MVRQQGPANALFDSLLTSGPRPKGLQQVAHGPGVIDQAIQAVRGYLPTGWGGTKPVDAQAQGIQTSDFSEGEKITSENEGYSAIPYIDSEGYWTVGYGELVLKNKKPFKASAADIKKWGGKKSGQSPALEIVQQRFTGSLTKYLEKSANHHKEKFRTNYAKYRAVAKKAVGSAKWKDLSSAWQNELSDLAYQLGEPRFRKFEKMLKALKDNRMEDAEYEFLSSTRAIKQTPRRAYQGFQRIRGEPTSSDIRTNAQAREYVLDALSAYGRNNAH